MIFRGRVGPRAGRICKRRSGTGTRRQTETCCDLRLPALQRRFRGDRLTGHTFRWRVDILQLIFLSGRRSDVGGLSGRLTDRCEEIKLGQMCRSARGIIDDLLRGYEGRFTTDMSKVWRWRCRTRGLNGGIVAVSGGGNRTQVWQRRSGCIYKVTTPGRSWIWHYRSEIRRGWCGVSVFRAAPVAGT